MREGCAGWGRHLNAAHPRTRASLLHPGPCGGGICSGQKQWLELDGRVRSGDKRGAAAPVKGEEAPPRH